MDDGESEAIILADELQSDVLIIDERRGRKVAQNLGITITGTVAGKGTLNIAAEWDGKAVGAKSVNVTSGSFSVQLDISEIHLWEAGKGGLYDLTLTFGEDQVKSYFGLRTTCFEGRK